MKNISFLLIFAFTVSVSCTNNKNCKNESYGILKLTPVRLEMKLPSYVIVDSSKYGDKAILTYNIKTTDSLLQMICFVKFNEGRLLESNMIEMSFQKDEVSFGRDSVKIISETFKEIEGRKVGFLKTLVVVQGKKFYDSRIFFHDKDKVLNLWLFENYKERKQDSYSLSNCIFENLIFY